MLVKSTSLLILALSYMPAATYAQVFDLGPSSPSLFDEVINIPPGVAMTSAESSTQINLAPGGTLLNDFNANAGSEINISGGTVGPHPTRLYANSGSEINISGGRITNLVANFGSMVNFWGGGYSNSIFTANAGSEFNLFGKFEFRGLVFEANSQLNMYGQAFSLNDVPLEGLAHGVPFEVTDRGNFWLDGLLLDGQSSRIYLSSVDPDATVTVTLIPEPTTCTLALAGLSLGAGPLLRRR